MTLPGPVPWGLAAGGPWWCNALHASKTSLREGSRSSTDSHRSLKAARDPCDRNQCIQPFWWGVTQTYGWKLEAGHFILEIKRPLLFEAER